MNKEQISAITMSVTLSYFVVVAMLQQNIQAYLYSQPPPGSDYKQYKVGWDQAQADAYYDQGNGKYRDYLSGADCHTYRGLLSRIHGRISRVCRQEFTSPSRPVECSREQ